MCGGGGGGGDDDNGEMGMDRWNLRGAIGRRSWLTDKCASARKSRFCHVVGLKSI